MVKNATAGKNNVSADSGVLTASASFVSAREAILLGKVLGALNAGCPIQGGVSIRRNSSREFDLVYEVMQQDGVGVTGWLPLAAIRQLVRWTDGAVADMTDHPTMSRAGDWSGVRDTSRERLWEIFARFVTDGEAPAPRISLKDTLLRRRERAYELATAAADFVQQDATGVLAMLKEGKRPYSSARGAREQLREQLTEIRQLDEMLDLLRATEGTTIV